ncbi:hypothetical protein FHX42_004942 [Saccharopolyspora lacisalsi]|uniref:Peptidoglycan recognition protein family domain-containing protein n=1 Tax=Halosaccharopolyspora lacisalsi TaxID=1000566 RepID=A0A839E4M1_9PSEU|nr:peptidoglycan recognition protein [Halosaccharopolyspora lacisalsi]MBA8827546.1 hypothetical protein [Halosaccharopolyspora lacisalsi]
MRSRLSLGSPGFGTLAVTLLLLSLLITEGRAGAASDTTARHIALAGVALTRNAVATREVHTPTAFSMVGLTWQGADPDDIRVRHLENGSWSRWRSVERIHSTGRPTPVRASESVWTGPTTAVQVRATRAGHDVSGRIELVAISPGRTSTPRAASRAGMPPVVSRSAWGADESAMIWTPEYTTITKAATVHHTAETNDYTCAQSAAIVRGVYHYHAVELGWGDIGYHALVDKCGTIFAGRTDGLGRNVVGGHTSGFNKGNFGVAVLGSYDKVAPTPAALKAVADIAGWKLAVNGVDPRGRTSMVAGKGTLFPEGTRVKMPTIFGHRRVNDTVCPGDKLYEKLPFIREQAAEPAP